jgi:DMSO/TMAO reductase YedYZ molybdopterin-dependent catalytic subunit
MSATGSESKVASRASAASGLLPVGQRVIDDFPRMGLPRRLLRRVAVPANPSLRIGGQAAAPCVIDLAELAQVPRRDQVSDFHCVLAWSQLALRWGGWPLRDVYEQLIVPRARPLGQVRYLKFVGADGFHASLALEFALADDVLLADSLDGHPLTIEHGAPLRAVAPAHYAYKSVKHLQAIELHSRRPSSFRPGGGGLVAHRDALVEHEQRGQLLPGPAYRKIYALARPAGLRAARWVARKRGIAPS